MASGLQGSRGEVRKIWFLSKRQVDLGHPDGLQDALRASFS